MKKTAVLLLLFCFSIFGFGQHYYQSAQRDQIQYAQFNSNQVGPSSYSIMYAVDAFVNIYNDAQREKTAREEAQSKVALLKRSYESYDVYPDSIATGWHNVIVTDNFKFCRDAKVFVKNNLIEEFVIDNSIRLNFTTTGKIRNGKNVVTLNRFNGERLEIVDVYFAYDLDEPRLASPPVDPGYVTFWTRRNKFVGRKIILGGVSYDGVSGALKDTPDCNQTGAVTVILKPGTYSFTAMKVGNDLDGTVEIKSNQCLLYELK
jgi:hypothetical protein